MDSSGSSTSPSVSSSDENGKSDLVTASSKMEEGKIPRQYRHGIRHSSSHDRSSSFRSKRGSESRRERRSRSRSRSHGRRSHWRRDHSREHRHVRHHRRHRSRSHEEARRRRRRDERRRRRSSSSSSSSSCQRSRHSSKREKERETGFSRKIIGSRSELAKAQEAVKPVDPIAAKIEAANKASAIMASAIRPGTTGGSTYNTTATPQEVLARLQETQMAQVRAKAEAAASAANLPRFYNPMSVNAAKLAEQQQKRKLLWSKKADPETEAKEVRALHAYMFFLIINYLCVSTPN
uniref:SMAP domain-containing protein n=1 Tax=Mesocestoides corti TaxID=53468 RepID=A0A5K3FTA1_MESCO